MDSEKKCLGLQRDANLPLAAGAADAESLPRWGSAIESVMHVKGRSNFNLTCQEDTHIHIQSRLIASWITLLLPSLFRCAYSLIRVFSDKNKV